MRTCGDCAENLWRADEKELFYVVPNGFRDQIMAAEITTKPGDGVFKAGVPQKLFTLDIRLGRNQRNSYDVTRDGQRFVVNRVGATVADTRSTMTVVVNWLAGLNRR